MTAKKATEPTQTPPEPQPATKPKGKDFTASAINLVNPVQVVTALKEYRLAQSKVDNAQKAVPKEYQKAIDEAQTDVDDAQLALKEAINEHGSYQDPEAGDYAVKYRSMGKEYHVEPFKSHFEKHTASVIEESINVKVLEGLVRGGLITQSDLEKFKVITKFHKADSYYIR